MKGLIICIVFSLCLCYYGVKGGGHLMSPVHRGSMYKYLGAASYGNLIKTDRNDNQVNCGGQHTLGGNLAGLCGVCGDKVLLPQPRPHEIGGEYAQLGVPTAVYNESSIINVTVLIESKKNGGFFEFAMCPYRPATEDCFQQYKLPLAGSGETRIKLTNEEGQVSLQLKLPNGITCNACAMRWTWVTANEYRCDPTGLCGLGYWDQITYVNCADVMILQQGQPIPADFQYPDYSSLYASIDGADPSGSSTAITTTTPSLTNVPIVDPTTSTALPPTTTASSNTGTTRFIPIITVPTGNPVNTGTTEKPPVVTESLVEPLVPIIVSGGGAGGAAAAGFGLSSLGVISPFLPLAGLAGLGGVFLMNRRRTNQPAGYPDPLMFYGQQGPMAYSAYPVLGGPMYLPSTQLIIEERRYKVPVKQQSYTSYGSSQNLHGYGTNNYGTNNYGNTRQNYG